MSESAPDVSHLESLADRNGGVALLAITRYLALPSHTQLYRNAAVITRTYRIMPDREKFRLLQLHTGRLYIYIYIKSFSVYLY
jgi:hypothetical protein